MPAVVYFLGGERDTCYSNGTSPLEFAGLSDSTYVRIGLSFRGTGPLATDYWGMKLIDPATGAYVNLTTFQSFRFDMSAPNGGATADTPVLYAVNSGGTVVFRIVRTSTTYKAQFWNGATFTDLIGASTFTIGLAALVSVVVNITPGASGSAEIFVDGSSVSVGTINDADCDAIAEWRFMIGDTNRNHAISQIACANYSLVGSHVYCRPPTGNSATNTAWTGAFGDVDEGVTTDTDLNTSGTAGQRETPTHAVITPGGGVSPVAVAIGARARNSAGGPQNMKMSLRIGASNYDSSYNVAGLGAGFAPVYAIWMLDPSTASAWGSNATSASTEAGYLSVA